MDGKVPSKKETEECKGSGYRRKEPFGRATWDVKGEMGERANERKQQRGARKDEGEIYQSGGRMETR